MFAGPSLHRDLPFFRRQQDGVAWPGPARCGDIMRAVEAGAVAIGLVDGLFDQTASPWHKEILYALENGVAIAGGGSLGALRAAECHAFGMQGIGAIFEQYASGRRIADADVAQLHAPAELNYLPLTEPLVNAEPSLEALIASEAVAAESARDLLCIARELHYTDRTYGEIIRSSRRISPLDAVTAETWLRANAIDQKRLDALAVLEWLRAQPACRSAARRDWSLEPTSQWLALLESTGDRP
jgi:hypothetical protein